MSEEPVRIEFLRSGGFAGMMMKSTVDTSELPADKARELEEMVGRADLDAAAARVDPGPTRGADRFQYDLVIIKGEQRYELTLPETAVTEDLKPIVERMTELAREG